MSTSSNSTGATPPAGSVARLAPGNHLHGFTLQRSQEIPEVACLAQLWRHDATGARLLSMITEDDNKVFGISFRTPPKDSTGIAHILEHSVLCGSAKYPVKEPFVELLKGSLQTFLNAFTYPDKTCYPVASANLQDFYNLIDVYLDAVFHPRLSPQVLAQEGWRYETTHADTAVPARLDYKGVVMGEMKGVYSSPDSLLAERSQQAVFPDTTYGLDSGGDPRHIPDLTFESFNAFHADYYHPSNSYIYFYGDDDPERRLSLMAETLKGYTAREVDSHVALQPAMSAPLRVSAGYAVSADAEADGEDADRETGGAMCTVNWLLPAADDAPGGHAASDPAATSQAMELSMELSMEKAMEQAIALDMLEHVLIGLPSSPLRKALLDSGLGEDITGAGLESELRQAYFSVGLKGMSASPADEAARKVEELILATLRQLADGGVDKELAEAAVNTIEFDLREQNTGRFPRGLSLMLRALTTWLHGQDPLAPIAFEAPLARVKARLADGEPVFESMIRTLLLDNAHRVTVLLTPDAALAGRMETEERSRLDAVAREMGPHGLEDAAAQAKTLREAQERPDAPEDLARIPRLGRKDLPQHNRLIPKTVEDLSGVPLLLHDLPTRAIAYLDIGMDLTALPASLLPWAHIFGRALLEMGTATNSFEALTRRIARRTGGIDAESVVGSHELDGKPVGWLFLRGKATADNAPELAAILRDVLLGASLDNRDRFRQMVLEEKARLEERIIPAGHMVVASRLKAGLGESGRMHERLFGVENLLAVRRMAEMVDSDWPAALEVLEALRSALIRRNSMVVNLTADNRAHAALIRELPGLVASLPGGSASASAAQPQHDSLDLAAAEGLAAPSQVNYVGKGVSLSACGYTVRGADMAVARYLRTAYLWDRVRVQGGAYGAFCSLDRLAGTLLLLSYRDPNLDNTLNAFDAMRGYLENLEIGADELTKSVVGAIGDMDSYLLPDAKGFTSLLRHLQGVSDDRLQQLREEVLATSAADFARFAQAAACVTEHGRKVVLGARQALEASGAGLRITKLL